MDQENEIKGLKERKEIRRMNQEHEIRGLKEGKEIKGWKSMELNEGMERRDRNQGD